MLIEFRKKKLEKCYCESRVAIKTYGNDVAGKYIQRINIIKQVRNLDELQQLPGLDCHSLKGDKGTICNQADGFLSVDIYPQRRGVGDRVDRGGE